MRKSKGFTLVELLVAIAVSVVVMALVGTTLVFLHRLDTNAITSSETMHQIQVVRDFVLQSQDVATELSQSSQQDEPITDLIVVEDGKILFDQTVIATDSKQISQVSFAKKGEFWQCTIVYGENQTYQFFVTKVTT